MGKLKKIIVALFCWLAINEIAFAETLSRPAENIKAYQPANKTISVPEVDVESVAEIGQTIVSKVRQTVHPAVSLNENITFKVETSFFSNSWTGEASINQGTLKLYLTTPDGSYFKDESATFSFSGGEIKADAGIFIPVDSSKITVPWYFSKKIFYFGDKSVFVEKTNVVTLGKDSFSKELIYSGMSQNTITISYREFSDNAARPAFAQELKYDLSQSDPIGFRGARFQIVKATNSGLVYKVIKPLD